MRAVVLEEPNLAVGVAESDQLLVQQQDTNGVAVGTGHLGGEHGRNPVLPHELTHRGAGPGATDQFVIFSAEHRSLLKGCGLACTGITVYAFLPSIQTSARSSLRASSGRSDS